MEFQGMIRWDLKFRSCCFYDTFKPKKTGVKAVYTGLGVTANEEEVEKISQIFLEKVLKHGKARAEQIDEDNLEVHRQLLKNAPRFWGSPVLENIDIN